MGQVCPSGAGIYVEPFVGGSNPQTVEKKIQFCMHKNYKFDKCTLIIKWYKILFDYNNVKCDYNMFNFKIYLILKNYDIL